MTTHADPAFEFAPPPSPQPRTSWYASKVKPRVAAGAPTPTRTGLTWVLATLSLLTIWFVFFVTVLASLQEAHNQHNAYALFREELTQLSPRIAPLGGTIKPDAPVALLSAPGIGLKDVVIIEGTASGDLTRGPGHKRNSPLPGQAGVSVVLGRATLFGGPFGRLTRAKVGDQLTVTTGQGDAHYQVEDIRRPGDPYPAPLAAGEGQLTLVSAEGGSWRNGWVPDHAVYVDAKLQGKPFPTPPGQPTSVPKSENTMSGDIGALFLLVLWLPLLVIAGIGAVWLFDRWGYWQTWLVGVPVILACLWGASETAVQLLPNIS